MVFDQKSIPVAVTFTDRGLPKPAYNDNRWFQIVEGEVAGVCSEGPSDEPNALKEWTLIAVDNKTLMVRHQ